MWQLVRLDFQTTGLPAEVEVMEEVQDLPAELEEMLLEVEVEAVVTLQEAL